jgi:hypothetical protein
MVRKRPPAWGHHRAEEAMDGYHFDRLSRQYGQMLSRRHYGALLTALGLGAALGVPIATEAKKKKRKKKCKNGAVRCGKGCADTRSDDDNCGECGHQCEANETCDESECVEIVACDPACRADGSANDQTCPGSTGYCPCQKHCGAGWCGECCAGLGGVSVDCYSSSLGPECYEPVDPNHAGNYICGCKTLVEGQVRKLCLVGEGCSTCCNHGECPADPGAICTTVVPSPFVGRQCCIPPGGTCGEHYSCCAGTCIEGTCTGCIPQGGNCTAFEACCSGICSTVNFKCE